LIVSSPVEHELPAVAANRGRYEAKLRVALDVEEVRRAEVALQVLVLDLDRAGVDDTLEVGRRLIDGQGRVELIEAAAERGPRSCA